MRSCAVETLTLLLKYLVAVELYATWEEIGSGAIVVHRKRFNDVVLLRKFAKEMLLLGRQG